MPVRENIYYNPLYADAARNLTSAIMGDPEKAGQQAYQRSQTRLNTLKGDRQDIENRAVTEGLAAALSDAGTDPATYAAEMPRILGAMVQAGVTNPANYITPHQSILGHSQSGAEPAEAFVRSAYSSKGSAIPLDLALTPERSDAIISQKAVSKSRTGAGARVNLKDVEAILSNALSSTPGATQMDRYDREQISDPLQNYLSEQGLIEPMRQIVVDTLRQTGGDQMAARDAVLQELGLPAGTKFHPEFVMDPPGLFNRTKGPRFVSPDGREVDLSVLLDVLNTAGGGPAAPAPFPVDDPLEIIKNLEPLTAAQMDAPVAPIADPGLPITPGFMPASAVPPEMTVPENITPIENNKSPFLESLVRSLAQQSPEALAGSLEGVAALSSGKFGDRPLEWAAGGLRDVAAKAEENIPPRRVPDLGSIVPEDFALTKPAKVKELIGRLGTYVKESAGQAAGSMLPVAAGTAIGGLAGTKIKPGIGTVVGAGAGGFSTGFAVNYGDIYNSLRDESTQWNQDNPDRPLTEQQLAQVALLPSAGVAALDALPFAGGAGRRVYQAALEKGPKEFAKLYFKELSKTAAKEGTTEGAQQTIQEGLAAQQFERPMKIKPIVEATVQGTIGGTTYGGSVDAPVRTVGALQATAKENTARAASEAARRLDPRTVPVVEETATAGPAPLPVAPAMPEPEPVPAAPEVEEPAAPAGNDLPVDDSRETIDSGSIENNLQEPDPAQDPEPLDVNQEPDNVSLKAESVKDQDIAEGFHSIDVADRYRPDQILTPAALAAGSKAKIVGAGEKYITDSHTVLLREGRDDFIPAGKAGTMSPEITAGYDRVLSDVAENNPPAHEFVPIAGYDTALLGPQKTPYRVIYGKLGDEIVALPARIYDGLIRQKGYTIKATSAKKDYRNTALGVYDGDQLIGATMPVTPNILPKGTEESIRALEGRVSVEQARQTEPGGSPRVERPGAKPRKGMNAQARAGAVQARDGAVKALDEIARIARQQVAAGDTKYTGPAQEIQIKTPSGRITKFKTSRTDPEGVAEWAENVSAGLKAKGAETFASKLPGDADGKTETEDDGEVSEFASSLPSADSNGPRAIVNGRQLEHFSVNNKPSFRRKMFEAAGIDPAEGVNMPPKKQMAVAARLFREKFGIDIMVDPAFTNYGYAIDNVLDAWVTFQFFARAMGLPNKAIGLNRVKTNAAGAQSNGRLKLSFTKKISGTLGLFHPDTNMIAIPERSNSFSHEWAHALDFYILDAMGKTVDSVGKAFNGYSSRIRREGVDYTPGSLEEAWVNLMNTIFFNDALGAAKIMELEQKIDRARSEKSKQEYRDQIEQIRRGNYRGFDYRSPYYNGAKSIPKGSDKGYWTRPTEMLARAFEAYVAMKMEQMGGQTEMLTKGNDAYLNTADSRIAATYPQLQDRQRIFLAFDQMLEALRKSEILQDGDLDPATNDDLNTLDEKRWEYAPLNEEKPSVVAAVKNVFSRESREMRKDIARYNREAKAARPEDPQGIVTHLDTMRIIWTATTTTMLRTIAARNPTSPSLRRMVTAMTKQYGTGELRAIPYRDKVRRMQRRYNNILVDIEKQMAIDIANGPEMEVMGQMLQGLPVSSKIKLKPERMAKIREAAARVREGIYKSLYYDLRRAGVDVGYLSDVSYMNQIWDRSVISTQIDKSRELITKAYVMTLEKEYEGDIDLDEFIKTAQILGNDERLEELRSLMEDAEDGKYSSEAYELAAEMVDDVIELLAPLKAETLIENILTGSEYDLENVSSTGMRKNRVFVPETLPLLSPLRVSNPAQAARQYIGSAARLVSFYEAFPPQKKGQTPENFLFELKRAAVMEEGANPEDAQLAHEMVLELAGKKNQYVAPSGVMKISNWIRTFLSINLLGRSVFSSLPENFVIGLRSGRVRDSYIAIYKTMQSMINAGDARETRRSLEYAGILANKMADIAATELYGGTFEMDPRTEKMSSVFYENNLVGPLTRHQKHGNSIASALLFRSLSDDILDPKTKPIVKQRAIADMKDHGIRDPEAFARYIESLGALMFPAAGDNSPMADQFWNAIFSMVETSIQSPSAETRPRAAMAGRAPLMYAIMGYNFAYYDHAIKAIPRWYKAEVERQGGKNEKGFKPNISMEANKARLNTMARFLPPYINFLSWTSLAFLLRTMIFNADDFEKKTEEEKITYILSGGLLYTMPLGPVADILYNAVKGVKYERDLTAITAGAGIGSVLQDIMDIIRSYQKNSDKSNLSERQRAKAIYDLTVLPASTLATATIPGPAGVAMGIANMAIGSKQAKNKAADITAGPDPRVKQ